MSRIGKAPITVPARRRRHRSTIAHVTVKGPKGTLVARHPRRHHRAPGGRHAPRRAPRRRAREPGPARPHPHARQQHGRRRHRRLHARSSRSSASATAPTPRARQARARPRLQPPGDGRGARRHHLRGARARRASSSAASTRRRVGQVAANIRAHPQARALQGQGRALRRRARAAQGREGREVERHEPSARRRSATPASAATGACARRCTARPSGRASRCSVRTSTSSLQVIDDGAGRTLAAASTVEADLRAAGAPATSTPPSGSARSSPSGPRPPASTKVVFDRGGFLYHGRVAAVGRRRPRSRTGVLMACNVDDAAAARVARSSTSTASPRSSRAVAASRSPRSW